MNLRQVSHRRQQRALRSISFTALSEADLPLLCRWLNNPAVSRWIGGHPRSPAEIYAKYLPRIRGETPTRCFLIRIRGTPIGHIQTYRIAGYPEYEAQVGLRGELDGVDLFIGEDDARHRGLGAIILRRFLADHVFAGAAATGCVISPDPNNRVAIRAYQKAGFSPVRMIRTSTGQELLMYVGQEAFRAEPAGLRTAARITLPAYLAALAYLTLRPSYPRAIETAYNTLGRGYLHIPAYFGLAVVIFLSLRTRPGKLVRQAGIVTAGCVVYGAALELLQAFVPGRTPNGIGVLFDTIGATAATVVWILLRNRSSATPWSKHTTQRTDITNGEAPG